MFRTSIFKRFSRLLSSQAGVLVERVSGHSGVAIVTFNSPSTLNALTPSIGNKFRETIQELKNDPTLRVVILTGAGKAFSAGGDLKFLHARSNDTALNNTDVMLDFYSRYLCVRDLPVPVIAAINGPAIGAGLALACACDIRIAAQDTRMGLTFATLGIHPGMGSTHFLPQIVGPQVAAQLLLTGETISGQEAEKLGLVLKAVAKEDVLKESLTLATKIANASPVAVRSCTRTLRSRANEGLDIALSREAAGQAHSYSYPDLKEGLLAVTDKRAPKFQDLQGPLIS